MLLIITLNSIKSMIITSMILFYLDFYTSFCANRILSFELGRTTMNVNTLPQTILHSQD